MKYLFVACFAFIMLSCASEFESPLLLGKWKTTSWIKLSSGKKMNNQMDFDFQKDGRYEVDYGSVLEKGKYWIANEYLHTVEDGMSEKKVKLILLTQDSMIFEMNRAGQIEKVTLVKE